MNSAQIEEKLQSLFSLSQQYKANLECHENNFDIKSHWFFKLIGWLGLLFSSIISIWGFGLGIFNSINSGSIGAILLAASGFTLLFLSRETLYFNDETITYVSIFGYFEIRWDETEKIVFDRKLWRVIFYGKDKWLSIPRTYAFVSGNRKGLAEFLAKQIDARKIPVETSVSTPWQSKGTKVW